MQEPQAFCRAVMHEYERQWSRTSGHGVRHPLRLKMEHLKGWCDDSCSPDDFEARLTLAQQSEDIGQALLADELLPLWRTVQAGGRLPFSAD
ncbi:MAG TPA: hypothetical protein VFG86_17230 [Chloroflexota bacterium]|jgi:hypothetical protein|nr:hypothetical protein [Chloroflexota bacterium]